MRLNIRGSEINYEVIGSGKPIFIFGGFANDMRTMKSCMEPQFEKIEGWKRIYAEHIGVGDTIIGDNIKTPEDVLMVMNDFVNEIAGGEKFALSGYSFGGYISRYILNRNHNNILGMMLLNPLINTDMRVCDVDREVKEINIRDVEVANRIKERMVNEIRASMIKTNFEFLNMMQEKVGELDIELETFEGSFHNPVLIITGRQDNTVGYRDAFKKLDKYPRASYCVLDMSGHESQISQEKIFNVMVEEWLIRMK